MNMRMFSVRNRLRCEAVDGFNHRLGAWGPGDWMTAVLGELGEAANIIKKLNRARDGIPGNTESPQELREKLAEELADTYIYLDLLCQAMEIDLPDAIIAKFGEVSRRIGYHADSGTPWT